MGLLDDLAKPGYRSPHGPDCGLAILIGQLDPKDKATLLAALANPHAPSSRIVEALKDMGHRTSVYILQRHRRQQCRCSQS